MPGWRPGAKRGLAWASLIAAFCATPGLAAPAQLLDFNVYAAPQQLVALPDGRRMNLFCTGQGAPTVILEAGWSNSTLAWRLVQPLIARTTRVCSYDRAGLGFSDPAAGPRDTAHIVADLALLLEAADLKPPYVLVGYSMGGLSMRLFADQHPGEVAGMVLVEPSGEHQGKRFAAALPGRTGAPRRLTTSDACAADHACPPSGPPLPPAVVAAGERIAAQASFQHAIVAELIGMSGDGSAQVAASRRPYGALPLLILTGADNIGDPSYSPAEVAAFRQVWSTMHDEVAALSSRGVHRQVAGATHLMVFEQPGAIADAVDEVIRQGAPLKVRP